MGTDIPAITKNRSRLGQWLQKCDILGDDCSVSLRLLYLSAVAMVRSVNAGLRMRWR